MVLQGTPDTLVLSTLAGYHQGHGAIRIGQQLGVEEIRPHRILETHRLSGDSQGNQRRVHALAQRLQGALLVQEGHLVVEQHRAVAHRDHIVVEDPGVDGPGVLLGEYRLRRGEAMLARHRLTRLQGLTRRKAPGRRVLLMAPAEGGAAIDVEMHPRLAMLAGQAGMVGRPLVGEGRGGGQHRMVGEARRVAEDRRQHASGGGGLEITVEARLQVGRGKVHATIGGIPAGRDGGGVGGPHARGGTNRAQ